MSKIIIVICVTLYLLITAYSLPIIMPIPTSDAIDIARIIAKNEGYDIKNSQINYFELIAGHEGKPFVEGYTTIAFYISGNSRNLIAINNITGQAIDYNTCEVFDYPDLYSFQETLLLNNKTKKKSPQELARDMGCGPPVIRNKPIPIVK